MSKTKERYETPARLTKTIMIAHELTAGGTDWSEKIANISFTPSRVIVQCVQMYAGAVVTVPISIWTDLTNDYLFSIVAPVNGIASVTPRLEYPIYGPVYGTYRFQVRDSGGTPVAAIAGAPELFFHLEFIA